MIKELLEIILSFIRSRLFILCVVFFGMFSILVVRIFQLQIVQGEYYQEYYEQKAEKTIYNSGTRGNIYDRKGKLLAYNKLAYAVTIQDSLDISNKKKKNEKLNSIIHETIKILEKNGDSLINDFPIHLNKDEEFVFSSELTERGILGALRDLYGKKDLEELEKDGLSHSTPNEVMTYLREYYLLSEDYSKEEALKIILVRYKMGLNSYQKYITIKVASNVSKNTVAAIYENQAELTGVAIEEETIRVYNDSTYFSHIIGYTGTISDEQLESYNANIDEEDDIRKYQSTDIVGKSGIEEQMEEHLQGTKGKKTVFANSTGKILEVLEQTDSAAGNDVYLTIDSNLQIATYNILEQKLAGILLTKIVDRDVSEEEEIDTKSIIPIAVKRVYFQLINNNVIDLSHFSKKKASENEKNIYRKFQSKENQVLEWMEQELLDENAKKLKSLPEENNTYLSYAYDKLKSNSAGIVLVSAVDTEDEIYQKWVKENISLRDFLLYAISKNWIDTSKLGIDEKYAETETLYQALIDYLKNALKHDTSFSKKIYYYLIQKQTITGNEICMALYDQNILKMNERTYNKLSSGSTSYAYDFIMEQIRQLKITPAQLALDPCSGSCIITDTDTGAVLAMVTYPSYDNNKLSGTVDAQYWETLNADLSTPLLNRATMTRTAPGSTFKMLTAIAGIEEGVINVGDAVKDEGQFEQITEKPKCWKFPGSHGYVNVSDALSVSCNYFFYELGYRLGTQSNGKFNTEYGLQRLEKYADLFGLTQTSGVQLGEYDPMFSTISPVHTAIGQGSNSFANVQLVRYVNTVANSGNNYQLTLLDKVVDYDGNLVVDYAPVLTNTVDAAQSTWDAVHKGMRMVVTEGTGEKIFKDCDIALAGKSGTAQEDKTRSSHSVFVAYAPYDNPEISLSVLIPYGESSGYTGEVIRDVCKYFYKKTKLKDILKGTASVPTSGITSD